MNKASLIDELAKRSGLTKRQVEELVEMFQSIVTAALREGKEVTLAGFGTFMAKERVARAGVNPRRPTERIQIPSVIVPKFRAGKTLKDALRRGR